MEPRSERDGREELKLGELLGNELIARVLAGRGAHAFALDATGRFASLAEESAKVLAESDPPVVGAPFHAEVFVPSARVTEQVAEALAGRQTEPSLVVLRHEISSQRIWQFEAIPIESGRLEGGRGVLCLLSQHTGASDRFALDSVLFSVTLSERLERERLVTTQALIVTIRHEINNALTSLIGNADLMLRRADRVDEALSGRLREILGQAYRIRDVLGKLEALTRIRTTTYLNGVQMVDLQGSDPPGDLPGGEKK